MKFFSTNLAASGGGGISLLGAFLFFIFLWLLDFPKPFIDDLCFCGTAINMAGGGDLSNPLLAWDVPGHFFFFYPPVQAYTQASWLKIFGISAAALTGFQLTMYFIMAVAVIAILRKNQSPVWLEWLVPLVVTAAFLGSGLRPEPLAAALTLAGFALIECGARKPLLLFSAFLLMFLGGATAPRMTMFSAAFALLAGYRLWLDSMAGWQRRKLILLGLAALLLTNLIFLWMLHFRIIEFWKTFHFLAQYFVTGNPQAFSTVLKSHFGISQQVFLLLAGIMSFFAFRHRSDKLIQICIIIGVVFPIEFFNRFLGYGLGSWYALLMLLFLSAVLLKQTSRAGSVILAIALGSLLLWINAPHIVEAFGILSGKIQTERGEQYKEARGLTSTVEHPLLLDVSVARYVFDYKLPGGSVDFWFCAPIPKVSFAVAYHPQDTYLLNPRWYDYMARSTYATNQPRPKWTFFKWSFDQYPCKVFIVQAGSCKGVKSAYESP